MNENKYRPFSINEQTREACASRLLVCSPQTALQHMSADYMRQWIRWQPGMLFRYGCLGFSDHQETYLGGLTLCQSLFLLVPESLYEQRRRAVLLQIVSEHLQIQDNTVLCAYCDLLEQRSAEGCHLSDHLVWNAEAQARQISSWISFLAHCEEEQTPDWCW